MPQSLSTRITTDNDMTDGNDFDFVIIAVTFCTIDHG